MKKKFTVLTKDIEDQKVKQRAAEAIINSAAFFCAGVVSSIRSWQPRGRISEHLFCSQRLNVIYSVDPILYQ